MYINPFWSWEALWRTLWKISIVERWGSRFMLTTKMLHSFFGMILGFVLLLCGDVWHSLHVHCLSSYAIACSRFCRRELYIKNSYYIVLTVCHYHHVPKVKHEPKYTYRTECFVFLFTSSHVSIPKNKTAQETLLMENLRSTMEVWAGIEPFIQPLRW